MNKVLTSLLAAFCLLLTFPGTAQDKGQDGKDKKKKEKSYSDIITDEAISDEGLFTVHKVDGKYYFEIPHDLLAKEILVVSRISGHVKGLNFGGAGMKSRPQQIIRWDKQDDQLLLRSVSYSSVASEDEPIYRSLRNNNFEPVIASYKIETHNEDSTAAVIEVSSLFTTDVPMIGALRDSERKRFKIKGLDGKRSFIKHMKAYPQNVEVRHVMTYRGDALPDNQITGTLSVEMNQSFIMLPEEPWTPRYYDSRVGYFSIQQTDYSDDAHKAKNKRYITRWRLEPSDWDAYKRGELVEPVKPIVYYLDPGTPEKWRPYLKKGIEDWQSAFEKAGFKNAIIAKDPPSAEEDPEWSPEDVRYSVIRYITTDIQNAQGPHVHDPRTGEIIESDILWYHNVMNLLRNWFFVQTAAVNPEAQTPEFKDELMGELIRFVAAHEVGHTLGLPHNMGSSVAYPVDSLRKAGFVQRMGVAPSIMDYARFNYVAQPEDKGAGLMPKIGPYDDWSIIFGYKLIDKNATVDSERMALNNWIKERANDPIYRYGQQQRSVIDPSAQTEDIGGDAVEASEMGIANLKRIVPNIIKWSEKEGEDYATVEELYGNVAGQFRRYMGHVLNNVGGIYEYDKTMDQEGVVYTHVDKTKQKKAVNFLINELFMTPNWMINKDILSRIEGSGMTDRIRGLQTYTLNGLLNPDRILRMTENEALNGNAAYTPMNLFDDTRRGVFSELYSGTNIDPYRRNLQRAYVDRLAALVMMTDAKYSQSDVQAMARGTLKRLEDDIEDALDKKLNDTSRYHLQDLATRVELIMDMEMPQKGGGSSRGFQDTDLEHEQHLGCWHH